MKNLQSSLFLLLVIFALSSCQKESIEPVEANTELSPESPQGYFFCQRPTKAANVFFTPGDTVRNSIIIDGETREYLIYVPRFYTGWWMESYNYPVVFMLHGKDQVAPRMVSHTGWTDLAESENLIAIFPQGWHYDMASGPDENRWATANTLNKIASTEHLRDDVSFMDKIRNAVLKNLRTDCRKFYACGFSNGGSFVKTEIKINLDDKFAATSSCGGVGLEVPLVPAHGHQRAHFTIVGTGDQEVFQKFYPPGPNSVPFDCSAWPAEPFWYVIENMATTMGFSTSAYACFYNPSSDLSMIVYGSFWAPQLAYRLRMIPNLGHKYPGPTTQRDFTIDFWNFMKGYTL